MSDQTAAIPASGVDAWAKTMQPLMKAMFPATPSLAFGRASDARPSIEQHFAGLNETWRESLEQWTDLLKEGTEPSSLTPEALRALFTPARWSGSGATGIDSDLSRVLDGPKFATLWKLDRDLVELQQCAVRRDKAVQAYQALVQRAWNAAFARFAKRLPLTSGDTPATWRGLADRWLEVANETLIEARRTDEFVEAQSRMLRAASDHRLKERELAEAWCSAFHIPTRSEMDEVQKTTTELRRRVRLLERRDAPTEGGGTGRGPVRKPRAASAATRRSTKAGAAR
ncbi:poly(R)-hydroxyalkanoic acid synthase subunit PhaE [Variovorax sp. J22R24]|uniref:poly(R)-hydroxyalkanoic acid synthase subunit PhaE n=1 Tax=Variovorax gracilis TaxID=3053502 RepID=UPI002575A6ED|nr:poly(R)-hydroxyalkanoic acid synthase subunit PhaE [Variovorax sp. J22R24]MDM0108419.1 poly(R)-hydroxyalkanoic acid synthase subunit PhaE [Variovorax sp. J22R24]